MSPDSIEGLQKRRAELRAALTQGSEMRRGSLVQRYRACGKPGCHCAQKGASGHGPIWSLTHAVSGKTITKLIPTEAVGTTHAQIAEYRRFRALSKELVEVSGRLCDARLADAKAASQEEAKEGASRPSSKWRSSRRSKSL